MIKDKYLEKMEDYLEVALAYYKRGEELLYSRSGELDEYEKSVWLPVDMPPKGDASCLVYIPRDVIGVYYILPARYTEKYGFRIMNARLYRKRRTRKIEKDITYWRPLPNIPAKEIKHLKDEGLIPNMVEEDKENG